jgi:preprotein translocase subunit Sec61beta
MLKINKLLVIMAEKSKQQKTPSTIAGLVRYDEEDAEALLKLKPMHVVAICSALIVIEIILFLVLKV